MSNLRPLGDRILVRPVEAEEISAGGVVLPDSVREKSQKGLVLAVGPGSRTLDGTLIPVPLTPGETVVFAKYGGTEIKDESLEDLVLLRELDVLAVDDGAPTA